MNDLVEVTTFAKRYAKAWWSQDPERVAAFFDAPKVAERGRQRFAAALAE